MWLIALLVLTILFFISSFFIDPQQVLAYRWMTMGMALVGFVYYFIVWKAAQKENKKMLGSHIAAVVVKFMLSIVVVISYGFIFGLNDKIDFVFFFIAYLIYSIVTYVGAYNYNR